MVILPYFLFLAPAMVSASPYLVTDYVQEIVETSPYTRTKTILITPTADPVPSPIKTAQSTNQIYPMTVVQIQLPPGAGKPITETELPSWDPYVPLTYSQCSDSTYKDSEPTTFTVADKTTQVLVNGIARRVIADMTPLTVYETTDKANPTGHTIALLNPSDIDPIQLASVSAQFQPRTCATATTTIDYRQACKTGKKYEMPTGVPASYDCGEMNPCCFGCKEYRWTCLMNCAGVPDGQKFYRCADGVDYYPFGGPPVTTRADGAVVTMGSQGSGGSGGSGGGDGDEKKGLAAGRVIGDALGGVFGVVVGMVVCVVGLGMA
ncbi:hypothetical protein FQN53_007177 [Emmonsiellopsis sp. PD_33]|nr:hypothetical protein FQN53_007177 [Emmonsiellopsis sp. PD_33]